MFLKTSTYHTQGKYECVPGLKSALLSPRVKYNFIINELTQSECKMSNESLNQMNKNQMHILT